MDVERPRRRQLRNLLVLALAQNFAHRDQRFLERQVLFRRLVVGVQNLEMGGTGEGERKSPSTTSRRVADWLSYLEEGRRTGTSGTPRRVRERKVRHVGHVGRRLFVAAPGNLSQYYHRKQHVVYI